MQNCSLCIHSRLVRTYVYVSTHMHTYTEIYIYILLYRQAVILFTCVYVYVSAVLMFH